MQLKPVAACLFYSSCKVEENFKDISPQDHPALLDVNFYRSILKPFTSFLPWQSSINYNALDVDKTVVSDVTFNIIPQCQFLKSYSCHCHSAASTTCCSAYKLAIDCRVSTVASSFPLPSIKEIFHDSMFPCCIVSLFHIKEDGHWVMFLNKCFTYDSFRPQLSVVLLRLWKPLYMWVINLFFSRY